MPPKMKCAPKGKKPRCSLPSLNKWEYVVGILPLLKTEKLSPCAMAQLECQDTHEI